MGAVLSTTGGIPLAWLTTEVSDLDCEILKVERGDCRAQAALEGLALLIALRECAPWWESQRLRAHVRSDSAAALGATEKMASPAYSMNLLARELALDVAWSKYGVELVSYGHVAGPLNSWADALSRLQAPTERACIPDALTAIVPTAVADRRPAWWLSFAGVKKARRSCMQGIRLMLCAMPTVPRGPFPPHGQVVLRNRSLLLHQDLMTSYCIPFAPMGAVGRLGRRTPPGR